MKTENIYGEEQIGASGERVRRLNGDFFVIRKDEDENLFLIDYAIISNIDEIQSIDFDIIFSNRINRIDTINYNPVDITNETVATTLTNDELEDFSLGLEYEADFGHLNDNSNLPELPDNDGNARGLYQKQKLKPFKEPSDHAIFR